jgi:cytochrome c6
MCGGLFAKDGNALASPFSKAALILSCALLAFDAQAGDVLRGAELYRQHCAACHGNGGKPVLPTAPDFTQHNTLLKPDLALLAAVRKGRGAMPSYDGVLREREILDIVAHLRTLR